MKRCLPSPCLAFFPVFFLAFGAMALVIFPVTGMWHLIDAEKMLAGGVLYQDVKTITPPLFYAEWLPFAALGIKSLLFYRFVGVFCLAASFTAYLFVLTKYFPAKPALLLIAVIYLIYIQAPWEMFNTYMYQASILAILSLCYFWKNPRLSMLFLGLSLGLKITVGGGIAIGYILTLFACGTLRLACRPGFYATRLPRRALLNILYLALALAVPVLLLWPLGLSLSFPGLLSEVFSGESKGGLLLSIGRPVVAFLQDLNPTFTEPNFFRGLAPLRLVYSVYGTSVIMPVLWLITVIFYIAQTWVLIGQKRLNRVMYYMPLALSALGASYASAMSANFRPDDVWVFSFAALQVYRYVKGRWDRHFLYSFGLVPLFFYAYFLFQGSLDSLVLVALAWWPARAIYRKTGLAFLIIALLLFSTFYIKMYQNTFAWWEHNIRGKDISGYSMGFFVTPYYRQLVDKLTQIKTIADDNRIQTSVLSFPTSSLPNHLFGYLPPWHYTAHHGDVFPKSQVAEEFRIISRNQPNFIVIARWKPERIKLLDSLFSAGGPSSQHELADLLDDLTRRDYRLCAVVASNPAAENSYNAPSYIYIRKAVYRENVVSFSPVCGSEDGDQLPEPGLPKG